MRCVEANGVSLHVRDEGTGVPVVFSNSLGTDLRLWDALMPYLPQGVRAIRYDTRGHGLSGEPAGPYSVDDLAADAAGLIEALDCGPVIFVGLSIGGLTALALAASRPDLIRAMVISNSAAKIGDATLWRERIALLRAGGLAAISGPTMERWFSPGFRAGPEVHLWQRMMERQKLDGYIACCEALAAADLTGTTGALDCPSLCIAGSEDGSTPPEVVRATADLIAGSRYVCIDGAGHLPCVEAAEAYAGHLVPFLKEHADV